MGWFVSGLGGLGGVGWFVPLWGLCTICPIRLRMFVHLFGSGGEGGGIRTLPTYRDNWCYCRYSPVSGLGVFTR